MTTERVFPMDWSGYRPLCMYDDLTANRVREINESNRIVKFREYEQAMNYSNAKNVLDTPDDELMWRLGLDAVQVDELKALAKDHLDRLENAKKYHKGN